MLYSSLYSSTRHGYSDAGSVLCTCVFIVILPTHELLYTAQPHKKTYYLLYILYHHAYT